MFAERPVVMGVVNITPDSFSDGGQFLDTAAAIAHAKRLIVDGAGILDIGGESTRPRATPVSEAEELARVLPVIEAVSGLVKVSIDTMKPAIARAAVAAGATIWNDVTALRQSPDSLAIAAELGCEVVLMHMLGEPGSMQDDPRYTDVVAEVTDFLAERAGAAMAAGVAREAISLDPGIGFGKTLDHNLALLANLDRIVALGFPVVLGVSRKRFIAALDPAANRADDRLGGSLAAALMGADKGAAVLRVHDVRQTVQALKVREAIHGAQ
jgi:dihydropteroate synthase